MTTFKNLIVVWLLIPLHVCHMMCDSYQKRVVLSRLLLETCQLPSWESEFDHCTVLFIVVFYLRWELNFSVGFHSVQCRRRTRGWWNKCYYHRGGNFPAPRNFQKIQPGPRYVPYESSCTGTPNPYRYTSRQSCSAPWFRFLLLCNTALDRKENLFTLSSQVPFPLEPTIESQLSPQNHRK